MSRARSALALALCWALLELRQRKALNPLSRQTITHNPRIRCALGTPQDAHNLGNNESLARCITKNTDGTFTAVTFSASKDFKTYAGAVRWLARRAR